MFSLFKKSSPDRSLSLVENNLKELGYRLTPYGASVAILSLESGYSHIDTASLIVMMTFAHDIKDNFNDIVVLARIRVQALAVISRLAEYKDTGRMQVEQYENDARAILGMSDLNENQEEWLAAVLRDPVCSKGRVGVCTVY